MQITQILQIIPFSRTGYIRAIRVIRVHQPSRAGFIFSCFSCFLCDPIISHLLCRVPSLSQEGYFLFSVVEFHTVNSCNTEP